MTYRMIIVLCTLLLSYCKPGNQQIETMRIEGLSQPVEVLRDEFGINHIYAENQEDLFFAQGYCAAKDRLFQFEIWRRQATGTVAEILGPKALERDHGTRLFKYRGDMTEEMNYYHDDGEEIITAYLNGVNAYIDHIMKDPEDLPITFKLLGITPEKWTPEVVVSRHQGLLGNINQELNIGRAVASVGPDTVQKYSWFHPKKPIVAIDPAIDQELLFDENILRLYNAYRRPVRFEADDLSDPSYAALEQRMPELAHDPGAIDWTSIGSNNWVVRGEKMESGAPVMANDPHRTIAVPSLRYMAHLVAPDWNVIGGGEPEIPGISIGHNEYGAWGLTVFRTDGEDLYVYELNPDNLNQYKYQEEWLDMEVIRETIKVKDQDDVAVALRYTKHGPITFIDSVNAKAYAVRCAWLEPGGSPYLASLKMDQAKSWEEFRAACNYSHIPGENMIWADKEGNIGWQSVGIAPIRSNFSGMVPVPGDGTYEWDGYLPIIKKPNVVNPTEGYFVTANENVTPDSYDRWNAIGFSWSDPFRGDRINEVLASKSSFNMEDMKALQTDYYSKPAEQLVPMLEGISFEDSLTNACKQIQSNWDFSLNPNGIAPTIYVEWERTLRVVAKQRYFPEGMKPYTSPQLTQVIRWIKHPGDIIPHNRERDELLALTFKNAINALVTRLGSNPDKWQYGQRDNKHVNIRHPLSGAVNDSLRLLLEVGPHPRGGNAYTPASTSNSYNQSSGASFKIIADCNDWDNTVGTNTPGQSGDPISRFYRNTFETWATDQYFPIYYTREKVESVTVERLLLSPKQ